MATPEQQSRAGLELVTSAAVSAVQDQLTDDVSQTAQVFSILGPAVVQEYGNAAATLALDFYDQAREAANVVELFTPTPIVRVREDYIVGNLAGWALEPVRLPEPDVELTYSRIAEVIQLETARAYRETTTENAKRDPAAVGWKRIARTDGCPMCQMLADKGAVFTKATARFAAHPDCNCTAAVQFKNGEVGPPASVMQYVASQRKRTPEQQYVLKKYLHENFGAPEPTIPDSMTSAAKRASGAGGFASLTKAQVELQIGITEMLKPTEWRSNQLARLRKRLAELT